MQKLTEEQVSEIINKIWKSVSSKGLTPITQNDVWANGGYEVWIDELLDEVDALRTAHNPELDWYSLFNNGEDVLSQYGLEPTEYLVEDRERLAQELRRLEYKFFTTRLNQLMNFGANPPTPNSKIIRDDEVDDRLLFSDLFKRFLEYKITENKINEDIQKEYQRYSDTFIDLEGDLPIDEIKRITLKEFIMEKYRYLPKRTLKAYKDKTPSELLEMEIPEEDLIADKTAKEAFKFLQGVFAYAVDKELLPVSPARDIKLNLEASKPYGAYTKAEVRKLLAGAQNLPKLKYWIVLLGAYTGARLGEIVQLRKKDLSIDADCGRYYIRISEEAGNVKNSNANRRIPLHNELLKAGFLAFVEKSGDELFPGMLSQSATRWFQSFRQDMGIPDKDEHSLKLVFHSFRHTFITIARSEGSFDPSLVQEVVGHEKVRVGITDRYTHRYPIGTLCKVVDSVSFSA